MRLCLIFLLSFLLVSCRQRVSDTESLQKQIDSLQKRLNQTYKPGLGEFMSAIHVHHAKLWFAGISGNWPLADFEWKEMTESVDDINTYCSDRPEVTFLPMLNPALDSIHLAIDRQNIAQFKINFQTLTNTCNSCHQTTKHGFNVIRIPDTPPFSNQEFQISPK